MTPDEVLAYGHQLALGQPGGTLATTHAEDGTPYVTYVLFHLCPDGTVLFGSGLTPQHTRNLLATPEASFLIDNRETVHTDWNAFDRLVVVGMTEPIRKDSSDYAPLLEAIRAKSETAATFTERGQLFALRPRRVVLMRGLEPHRHIVELFSL
ncbi:MAG: pyridoxamine 5'-phosphate oxidase family protein [Dehalococcoidia bacterium]